MFSLPSIGFSLYPEDPVVQPPVSTFVSVGTAAFPHIISAPSPFMATPLPSGAEKPAPKNERDGLGLFSQPRASPAGSEFTATPVAPKPVAAAAPPVEVKVEASAPVVSLADFKALQAQVAALEMFIHLRNPEVVSAVERIGYLEDEMHALQEHVFRDPFQGIELDFAEVDAGTVFGGGGGNAIFTGKCINLRSDIGTSFSELLLESDGQEDTSVITITKNTCPEGISPVSVTWRSDSVSEDEEEVTILIHGQGEESEATAEESEVEGGDAEVEESGSEAESNAKSETDEKDGDVEDDEESTDDAQEEESDTEADDVQKQEEGASIAVHKKDEEEEAAAAGEAPASKVRVITFNNQSATKAKSNKAPSSSPRGKQTQPQLAALAAKLSSKSERELSKILVPELTEMLAAFGETYTPPKHECVALLIRRAAEEKAKVKLS